MYSGEKERHSPADWYIGKGSQNKTTYIVHNIASMKALRTYTHRDYMHGLTVHVYNYHGTNLALFPGLPFACMCF